MMDSYSRLTYKAPSLAIHSPFNSAPHPAFTLPTGSIRPLL